ncbi:MAG: hypothetical protein NZ874_09270 [Fimbriimonadales bacterium]|nr:hypothetical protein [Fimbriimonadales bacterium]
MQTKPAYAGYSRRRSAWSTQERLQPFRILCRLKPRLVSASKRTVLSVPCLGSTVQATLVARAIPPVQLHARDAQATLVGETPTLCSRNSQVFAKLVQE